MRTAGLYGLHGSVSKGGNFVTRMIARAREQGALKVVADQRLTPTFTADLAAGILAAVEADVTGTLHVTNSGATSWHGFTEAIMELAGVDVPVEAATHRASPGAADRPLNGVLRSSVSEPPDSLRCGRGEQLSPTISSAPACSPAPPSDELPTCEVNQ